MQVKHHKTIVIGLNDIGGSALTDQMIDVPTVATEGIPVTYVPRSQHCVSFSGSGLGRSA